MGPMAANVPRVIYQAASNTAYFLEAGKRCQKALKAEPGPPWERGKLGHVLEEGRLTAEPSGAAGGPSRDLGLRQTFFPASDSSFRNGSPEEAPSGDKKPVPFPTGFLRQETLNCWDGPP